MQPWFWNGRGSDGQFLNVFVNKKKGLAVFRNISPFFSIGFWIIFLTTFRFAPLGAGLGTLEPVGGVPQGQFPGPFDRPRAQLIDKRCHVGSW